MVSRWCGSSCVSVGLSCSLRRSCSLSTYEDAGRNAAPYEPVDAGQRDKHSLVDSTENKSPQKCTRLHFRPGGGGEVTVWTLEGVGIQVRPLVVLHVGASVEGLHADATGKPLCAEAGRAHCRRRSWSFAAQLAKSKSERNKRLHLYVTQIKTFPVMVTSTCCRMPSARAEVR